METKVCTKCHQEFPITDFNYRNKAKETRRSECKYCHTKYMRDKYQEKKVIVQQWKTELCCAKCGESRGYVLDYHHIDPSQKEDTIARMISNNYTLDKVKQEIEKCICLCANCHREFHYLEENDGMTIDLYLQK